MKRVTVAAIAVALVVGLAAARRMRAAELTAGDVVARSVAARGGADAWRKVETMVWSGRVESELERVVLNAPLGDAAFARPIAQRRRARLGAGTASP